MKDARHHMKYLQRKVIQSSRKSKNLEEIAGEKNEVWAANSSFMSNTRKKKI